MHNSQIAALVIWWCEGTKVRRDFRWKYALNYSVEVINTNPKIVKIFTDYLINELSVDRSKLKGQIQIHIGDNQEEIEQFWTTYLGIAHIQLNKTIIRANGHRKRNNFGTFKIRLYDKRIYQILQMQLDSLVANFEIKDITNLRSVAQLVERPLWERKVPSSNLGTPTKKKPTNSVG